MENPIVECQLCFVRGTNCVKKNSCLIPGIVSFDPVKSWNSIFLNSDFFSFNSYVYYLTRGFIASTRFFKLLTCAFNLPTRAFNLAARTFSLLTRGFQLVTGEFELVTREFEFVTRGFELVTRNS